MSVKLNTYVCSYKRFDGELVRGLDESAVLIVWLGFSDGKNLDIIVVSIICL